MQLFLKRFGVETALHDQGDDRTRKGLDAEDPARLLQESYRLDRRGRVSQASRQTVK
jgi:hypothetical protein